MRRRRQNVVAAKLHGERPPGCSFKAAKLAGGVDGANRHSVYAVRHDHFIVWGAAFPSCQVYRWARAGGSGVVVRAGAGAGAAAGAGAGAGVAAELLLPLPPKRKRCGLCARSVIARPAISI